MRIQIISIVLILALVGGIAAITSPVAAPKDPDKGNQAPSGPHVNLNIIGVPNAKNPNFDGGQGHRIFVLRTGSTQVYVHGEDGPFQILDRDGTDGKVGESRTEPGIIFPFTSGTWDVEIYVRLLGPKDSSIKWKSYYFDGAEYVKWYEATWNKENPPKFNLKTGDLLKDGYEDILWEMDEKNNFRILQMRIYLD